MLVPQSKFSDPRKFTLRYQQFEIKGVELKCKEKKEITFAFFFHSSHLAMLGFFRVGATMILLARLFLKKTSRYCHSPGVGGGSGVWKL